MYRKSLLVVVVCVSVCNIFTSTEAANIWVDYVDSNNESYYKESTLSEETENTEPVFQKPGIIVLELKDAVLETFKHFWQTKIESLPTEKIILGTFDSKGVKDNFVFNETNDFQRKLSELEETLNDRKNYSPTFHVLNELIQHSKGNCNVVVVTMTKPSDEDYSEVSAQTSRQKGCQLSVLWVGDDVTHESLVLKSLALKTGGKFAIIQNELTQSYEASENPKLQKSNIETFESMPRKFRFQDEQKELETPLVSRAVEQKGLQKISVPLIVEVASGANLELRPGSATQIPFTVKNNINIPLSVFFKAEFNRIVQNVQPQQQYLQPGSSVVVTVNMNTFSQNQVSALGTLTLFAVTANKVIPRSALISLTPQTVTDTSSPKFTYKYEGDCYDYREPQNCENGNWGLQATIHDEDSGLLKVLSEPYGLLFQSEFVAGTKTPVIVTYRATCCQPNVNIWAEDLKGNYVKKSFDVFNQSLLAGEIASVVLGVLLIIFIIIGIIVAIVLIKRRNRRNLIIPRARAESR